MNQTNQPLSVWWIIWASMLSGVFMLYQFVGDTAASSPEAGPEAWWLACVPLALSAVIRWLVLPRAAAAQAALQLFIVGMAMAEATCILGLFVFPAHKLDLFLLSACGILQFMPLFARRYFVSDDHPG